MMLLNPVFIIFFIWIALLAVSNISLTGLDIPSLTTQVFIVFNLLFVVLGAFFYKLVAKPSIRNSCFVYSEIMCLKKTGVSSTINSKKLTFYYLLFFIFVLVPILIPFLKAINFIYTHSYFEYLALTRWSGGSRVEAFGSNIYLSMINYVFLPFSYALFFISVGLYFKYNHFKLLFMTMFALLVYSFLLTSRAEILMILLTLFYAAALNKRLKSLKLIGLALSLLSLIFVLSLFRFQGSFLELLGVFVINYHTFGFTMLDKVLNNDIVMNYSTGFGLYTFPIFSIPVEQISNFLPGERYIGHYAELTGLMAEPQVVGVDKFTGEPIIANAFYTVMFPIFADFNFFSFMLFFIYGFFTYRVYVKYKNNNDVYYFSILLFLFFLGYNSLFFPLVMREFFWLSLLVLILIQKVNISKLSVP